MPQDKSIKILTWMVTASLIINVISFLPTLKSWTINKASVSGQEQNIQEDNNQQPTPDVNAIQTFNITKNDKVKGNFNAPVTLVEFSDFECPFCERHFSTVEKILKDYGDKVRLVFKYFPLSFHPNAQKAAEAAECANEQGKFWQYHDKLFTNQSIGFSTDNFKKWAGELGLNTAQFNQCLDSGKYAQKVKNEYNEGSSKGVDGTPATFINGKLITGAMPYDTFKTAIDAALK